MGAPIEKDSPQARLVIEIIDGWLAGDDDCLETLFDRIGDDYGQVVRLLIVVLAGTIDSIARYAGKTFDDVLPGLLAQFAARTDSVDAADLARRALTAWSSGDDELVIGLDFDTEIARVGPDVVLLHLLAMLDSISRSWADQAGIPFDEIRSGWAIALGT